jgi:UPF0755 protein
MKAFIIFLSSIFILGLILLSSFLWDSYFSHPNISVAPLIFSIESGETAKEISKDLQKKHLIESSFFFETYIWLSKTEKDFQPGTYELQPNMSYVALVRILTSTSLAKEISLTIPEGFTLKQIGKRLEEKGLVPFDNCSRKRFFSPFFFSCF